SEEDNVLTLHVLDLKDEDAWRRTVQQRYEKPLMEIFE
ncbi:MAG TPA: Na+/H+ antiporter subunit E, partial [Burkholderiaceae bacterium]|nr:Na+/H+ antiporter subunit E [Burkholderiaceae bacterium]